MPARPTRPKVIEVAGEYKTLILSGDLLAGDRLPSVRALAAEQGIPHKTAQQVIEYLRTEGLVTTGPDGTFAAPGRVVYGPQQISRGVQFPAAWSITVRAAELITTPRYVIPIIGAATVIRREWVSHDQAGGVPVPFMLSVSWCPPWAAEHAPELLLPEPLPGGGSAAQLIAARAHLDITWTHDAHEARPVKDDGREAPLLGLTLGAHVLAEVYQWGTGTQTLEYLEFILKERKVVEADTAL